MPITHDYLNTTGFKPTAAEADTGELIPNLADGTLWTKNVSGTVIPVGGTQTLITQNKNLLEEDFTLATGYSGVATNMSIDDGVTLTIPDGSILTVV